MSGVFVTRGMTVTIPKGGLVLSFGEDGKPKAGNITVHVHYDLCPKWLELAFRHLGDARERKLARDTAWKGANEEAKGQTLEGECEAAMQAIMAAAIGVDSFYASLRDKTTIPTQTIQIWRDKRTARYKRVAETLRQAFSLLPRDTVRLRKVLKDIYRFRDWAVHPPGEASAPVLHPELQIGVEWRFIAFSAANAEPIVQGVHQIIGELVTKGKPANPDIQRYADGIRDLIPPLTTSGSGNQIIVN